MSAAKTAAPAAGKQRDEVAENLALWESVRTPDPEFTKPFKKAGGFSGTSIAPVYLIRCATELWGPIGGSWGPEIIKEEVIKGAPLIFKDRVIGSEQLHKITIGLRHPGIGKHPPGVVPAIGNTLLVGSNKYGPFTDEDAPKKSLTDAVGKALSWLGFGADIHMGLFDDVRYQQDVAKQYARRKAAEKKAKEEDDEGDDADGAGKDDAGGLPWYAEALKTLDETKDGAEAQRVWLEAQKQCKAKRDTEAYELLSAAATKASERIRGSK